MVMLESLPPISGGGLPGTLLTTTTATAPAFCAFFTFCTKVQAAPAGPRSTRATLPEREPSGPHAKLSDGTCRTPVIFVVVVIGGPKEAVPTRSSPNGGLFTVNVAVPSCRGTLGTCAVAYCPSQTNFLVLIAEAMRCALVIWSQWFAVRGAVRSSK